VPYSPVNSDCLTGVTIARRCPTGPCWNLVMCNRMALREVPGARSW
jgi:hypothetical protein